MHVNKYNSVFVQIVLQKCMRQPLVDDETVDWLGCNSIYSVLTQCSVSNVYWTVHHCNS